MTTHVAEHPQVPMKSFSADVLAPSLGVALAVGLGVFLLGTFLILAVMMGPDLGHEGITWWENVRVSAFVGAFVGVFPFGFLGGNFLRQAYERKRNTLPKER